MTALASIGEMLEGARCWGIELDPQYRVLSVTVELDPRRAPRAAGEHQLLCFPVSVLLVTVTRPLDEDGVSRTALVTFELDQLTAVSERFGGAIITGDPLGHPEPRPGSWGPRHSLEGRTSAADGTRATLTLDLMTEDGARLRLFARFDDLELRDAARQVVRSSASPVANTFDSWADTRGMPGTPSATQGPRPDQEASHGTLAEEPEHDAQQKRGAQGDDPDPLRF